MRQHVHASLSSGSRNTTRSRGALRGTYRNSPYARIKPEGGFCFIPAMALIATWWAYKARILGLVEVRVWLAFFEVVARRCEDRSNRFPDSVEHELATLVRVSETQVRTAIRRLIRTGFLLRTRTLSRWRAVPQSLVRDDGDGLDEAIRGVENHRRLVPVPRRLLRFLTRTTRPVLWATALGHLLRCLYYRNGKCAPDGRCKASWIAERLEVDARNVKAARRELSQLGVLIMEPTDQRSMNRWGPRVRFNLDWRDVAGEHRSPPRCDEKPRRLPPPYRNRELASRMGNQKPPRAPAGTHSRMARWRVSLPDLESAASLNGLFRRLVDAGACEAGELSRLNFFAAAARTKRLARSNPPGFLAALVRHRRWSFASCVDEDVGRTWLGQLSEREPLTILATRLKPVASAHRPARGGQPDHVAKILQRVIHRECETAPASHAPIQASEVRYERLGAKRRSVRPAHASSSGFSAGSPDGQNTATTAASGTRSDGAMAPACSNANAVA